MSEMRILNMKYVVELEREADKLKRERKEFIWKTANYVLKIAKLEEENRVLREKMETASKHLKMCIDASTALGANTTITL